MDDDTRQLLQSSLDKLKDYRDVCEEDGAGALVKSIDALRDRIQIKMDNTIATTTIDHDAIVDLKNIDGEFVPMKELHKTIIGRALLQSKTTKDAAKRLGMARSSLYRNMESLGLKPKGSNIRRRSN